MNVINGSHYYNKEMIAEFLIMISVNPGSFKPEQPGREAAVTASPPAPGNAKQRERHYVRPPLVLGT